MKGNFQRDYRKHLIKLISSLKCVSPLPHTHEFQGQDEIELGFPC